MESDYREYVKQLSLKRRAINSSDRINEEPNETTSLLKQSNNKVYTDSKANDTNGTSSDHDSYPRPNITFSEGIIRSLFAIAALILFVVFLLKFVPRKMVSDLNPYAILDSNGLRIRLKTTILDQSYYIRVNMPSPDLILGETFPRFQSSTFEMFLSDIENDKCFQLKSSNGYWLRMRHNDHIVMADEPFHIFATSFEPYYDNEQNKRVIKIKLFDKNQFIQVRPRLVPTDTSTYTDNTNTNDHSKDKSYSNYIPTLIPTIAPTTADKNHDKHIVPPPSSSLSLSSHSPTTTSTSSTIPTTHLPTSYTPNSDHIILPVPIPSNIESTHHPTIITTVTSSPSRHPSLTPIQISSTIIPTLLPTIAPIISTITPTISPTSVPINTITPTITTTTVQPTLQPTIISTISPTPHHHHTTSTTEITTNTPTTITTTITPTTTTSNYNNQDNNSNNNKKKRSHHPTSTPTKQINSHHKDTNKKDKKAHLKENAPAVTLLDISNTQHVYDSNINDLLINNDFMNYRLLSNSHTTSEQRTMVKDIEEEEEDNYLLSEYNTYDSIQYLTSLERTNLPVSSEQQSWLYSSSSSPYASTTSSSSISINNNYMSDEQWCPSSHPPPYKSHTISTTTISSSSRSNSNIYKPMTTDDSIGSSSSSSSSSTSDSMSSTISESKSIYNEVNYNVVLPHRHHHHHQRVRHRQLGENLHIHIHETSPSSSNNNDENSLSLHRQIQHNMNNDNKVSNIDMTYESSIHLNQNTVVPHSRSHHTRHHDEHIHVDMSEKDHDSSSDMKDNTSSSNGSSSSNNNWLHLLWNKLSSDDSNNDSPRTNAKSRSSRINSSGSGSSSEVYSIIIKSYQSTVYSMYYSIHYSLSSLSISTPSITLFLSDTVSLVTHIYTSILSTLHHFNPYSSSLDFHSIPSTNSHHGYSRSRKLFNSIFSSSASSTSTTTTITSSNYTSTLVNTSIDATVFEIETYQQQRGVNLGGWFIPEVWMLSSFFNSTGLGWGASLCAMMNYSIELTENRMIQHLATWITEKDFQEIHEMGFNSIRLPVGYWNIISDPYKRYAPLNVNTSLYYIDWAFNMSSKYNLTVLLDLHGVPGSQNGQDHSGCGYSIVGQPQWPKKKNVKLTLETIRVMAERYAHHPQLLGIELMNEPSQYMSENNHTILQKFYQDAYHIIRTYSNTTIIVLNELYEKLYSKWNLVMLEPEYYNVMVDMHLYDWGDIHNSESRSKHLLHAMRWGTVIEQYSRIHPIIIGEWCMSTGTIVQVGQPFVDTCVESFQKAHSWYLWNWKIEHTLGFYEWDVSYQYHLMLQQQRERERQRERQHEHDHDKHHNNGNNNNNGNNGNNTSNKYNNETTDKHNKSDEMNKEVKDGSEKIGLNPLNYFNIKPPTEIY